MLKIWNRILDMKRLIYIIIILLGYNGFSQDYYVSKNGNDKNNGRSESTSWKTLDKVNKEMKKFRSGDVVAFKTPMDLCN